MFVVNGFARGRRRKHLSHADFWEEFWKDHDAIGPPVFLHKVWRSHATQAEIAAGLISPLESYDNEAADKLAARGALRNALSKEHAAATRDTDSRARLVQTRLVEINLLHDRKPSTRRPWPLGAAPSLTLPKPESVMISAVCRSEKGGLLTNVVSVFCVESGHF